MRSANLSSEVESYYTVRIEGYIIWKIRRSSRNGAILICVWALCEAFCLKSNPYLNYKLWSVWLYQSSQYVFRGFYLSRFLKTTNLPRLARYCTSMIPYKELCPFPLEICLRTQLPLLDWSSSGATNSGKEQKRYLDIERMHRLSLKQRK